MSPEEIQAGMLADGWCEQPEGSGLMVLVESQRVLPRYVERVEHWCMPRAAPAGTPFTRGITRMTNGYANDGSYVGDADTCRLLDERGITPERRTPESKVASVGLSDADGRFYGWSHRAISDFATRPEAEAFAESVASIETGGTMSTKSKIAGLMTGTTELRRRMEVAASGAYQSTPGDPVLLQGDVLARYESMMLRRKVAALAMQHRETQRYDKKIALLRAALGLPDLPPAELVRTHITMRDPTASDSLEVSSEVAHEWDARWSRRVTARGLERLRSSLHSAGYAYRHEQAAGGARLHSWSRSSASGPQRVEVATVGNVWATSFSVDGEAQPLVRFVASSDASEAGVPPEMTGEDWSGGFTGAQAQAYARAWSSLVARLAPEAVK